MRATDPIVNQFIEPDHEFDFNPLNRNLCFGGSKKPGTGGVVLPDLGINTEQEMFTLNENLKPNTDQFRGGTVETINQAVTGAYDGAMNERDKLLGIGDYGQTQDTADTTTTDTATDTTDTTDTTLAETVMTADEKRNKIRQLMASRYGRSKTILTGGSGVSGFGV